MALRRYLRTIRVTIGDAASAVVIDGLFVHFNIRREATSTPAEGTIDIYNLNESNETRIRERAVRVLLEAGYQGAVEPIFDGVVRRVERQRVDLDRIVRVHVGGKISGAEVAGQGRRSVFVRGYETTVSVRELVADGVETLGLVLGDISIIPEDAVETDFSYNGDTQLMLRERLRPLGIEWYEEDGVVRFSKIRASVDDRIEGVVISERTGMLGSPTETDDGVTVRTLLDPRLRLDTRIRIESSVLDRGASGDAENIRAGEVTLPGTVFKVVEVTHEGDNREGPFETTVQARPLDA